MPSKSQRAASRQAKLRKNKKRGKIASRVFNSAPSSDISNNTIQPSSKFNPSATDQILTGEDTNRPQSPTLKNPSSVVYTHLPRELRHILVLAAVMFAILGGAYLILMN